MMGGKVVEKYLYLGRIGYVHEAGGGLGMFGEEGVHGGTVDVADVHLAAVVQKCLRNTAPDARSAGSHQDNLPRCEIDNLVPHLPYPSQELAGAPLLSRRVHCVEVVMLAAAGWRGN